MSNALFERYRPKVWSDVVGQEKALSLIDRWRRSGRLTGRAVWIVGNSGTGKTTIAQLLADEVAEPSGVIELDSRELTPHRVDELARSLKAGGLLKRGRVVIVNQPDGLRQEAVSVLLTKLEQIPADGLWIFTATAESEDKFFQECLDGRSLWSRCVPLRLARTGLSIAFAERARFVAEQEGLGGKPPEAYSRLAQDCRNNLHAMLSEIESGAMLLD